MVSYENIKQMADKKDIDGLINALKISEINSEELKLVINFLVNIGPLTVEPLMEGMKSSDEVFREKCIVALAEISDPQSFETLIQALNDDYPGVRYQATRGLALFRNTLAFDPLMDISNNDHYDEIRGSAVFSLGYMDSRAFEPLINFLDDSNDYIRYNAIRALVVLNDTRAIEPLKKLSGDPNIEIRDSIAFALDILEKELKWKNEVNYADVEVSTLNNPAELILENGEVEPSEKVTLWNIKEMGNKKDIKGLIKVIEDDDCHLFFEEFKEVRNILLNIGSEALSPLIEATNDSNYYFRLKCIDIISYMDDPCVIKHLINALDDPEADVRKTVARGLSMVFDYCVIEPLIRTLNDSDEEVRLTAAKSLASMGHPSGFKYLFEALENEKVQVQIEARNALERNRLTKLYLDGKIKNDEDVSRMVEHNALDNLYNYDGKIRYLALKALFKMNSDILDVYINDIEDLFDFMNDPDAEFRVFIIKIISDKEDFMFEDYEDLAKKSPAVKPLINALKDSNTNVQLAAFCALCMYGRLDDLIDDFKDKDYFIELIDLLKRKEYVEDLIEDLEFKNYDIFSYAIKAIDEILKPIAPLNKPNEDIQIQTHARNALEKNGKFETPNVNGEIKDDKINETVISEAIEEDLNKESVKAISEENNNYTEPVKANDSENEIITMEDIKQMGEKRDIEGLIRVLKDEKYDDSYSIVCFLVDFGSESVEPLIKSLKNSDDPSFKSFCIYILGRIRDKSSLNVLEDAFEDPTTQRAAAGALAKIGDLKGLIYLIEINEEKIAAGERELWGDLRDSDFNGKEYLIEENDPILQKVGMYALKYNGKFRDFKFLNKYLKNPDPLKRIAALNSMDNIFHDTRRSASFIDDNILDALRNDMVGLDIGFASDHKIAYKLIMRSLKDPDSKVQLEAKKSLLNMIDSCIADEEYYGEFIRDLETLGYIIDFKYLEKIGFGLRDVEVNYNFAFRRTIN